jgi:hypothetical protein
LFDEVHAPDRVAVIKAIAAPAFRGWSNQALVNCSRAADIVSQLLMQEIEQEKNAAVAS